MAPGETNKFGDPMFEPETVRKQMYCFEKSAYDIVVTFWPPRAVIRLPGNFAPCPLFVLVIIKHFQHSTSYFVRVR